MKAFHKQAIAIHELGVSLENISNDDRKEISDYTQSEIVAEAEYVLSTFKEGGHINNDELNDPDPEISKPMKKQLAQLQRFIKEWS